MAFLCCIIFLLKEHVVFALTSSLTRNLSEIYSSFDILLILNEMKYSETCQVDHLHKVTTCRCWPHIGRTGEALYSLHIRPPLTTSVTFPPLYVGYLSMFPMRNGTGVLFIPAYIDHGSTSGQSNGASHCYVVCYLLYVFLETLSTCIS